MKMQEDLATLMTQRLKLDNNVSYYSQPDQPPTPPQPDHQQQMTYITQHYHHSAHQATSTPPAELISVNDELANHGVDASALVTPQLDLFKKALPDQQLRLIQLWSIAPPTNRDQMAPQANAHWEQTSMQQEEAAAWSRYVRMQGEPEPHSPDQRQGAEPYIIRGYDISSSVSGTTNPACITRLGDYNRALDPAYRSREWWMRESQPIEHQYGVVQQVRQLADQDEEMS